MEGITGQHIAIAGGAGDIGSAMAAELTKHGGKVTLIDRTFRFGTRHQGNLRLVARCQEPIRNVWLTDDSSIFLQSPRLFERSLR